MILHRWVVCLFLGHQYEVVVENHVSVCQRCYRNVIQKGS